MSTHFSTLQNVGQDKGEYAVRVSRLPLEASSKGLLCLQHPLALFLSKSLPSTGCFLLAQLTPRMREAGVTGDRWWDVCYLKVWVLLGSHRLLLCGNVSLIGKCDLIFWFLHKKPQI